MKIPNITLNVKIAALDQSSVGQDVEHAHVNDFSKFSHDN